MLNFDLPSSEIRGLSETPEELLVQKSLPLLSLFDSNFSLQSFKVLDAYLARINSHEPQKRVVVFEKGELEYVLGIKQLRPEYMKKYVQALLQPVDITEKKDDPTAIHAITLFEEAEAYQDVSGAYYCRLKCTESAMQYIFNVENIRYLRYKLRTVTQFSSRYTYLLFLYIEANRFKHSWNVTVSELRKYLSCENVDLYDQYKFFSKKVLNPSLEELLTVVDYSIECSPIRTGRFITSLNFTITNNHIPSVSSLTAGYNDNNLPDNICYEVLQDIFSKAEIDEILVNVLKIPVERLPVDKQFQNGDTFEIEARRALYLQLVKAKMLRIDEKKPIRNKLSYMLKIIEKDAELI